MSNQKEILEYEEKKKSEIIGVVLNCLIPGMANFYCGNNKQGLKVLLLFFIMAIACALLIAITFGLAAGITVPALWIFLIYDGYSTVKKYNIAIIKKISNDL